MDVADIRVFIPAKDFEQSKSFYQQLGFQIGMSDENLCEFINGECSFFLQNFYHKGLAENLMCQLVVSDLSDTLKNINKIDSAPFKLSGPESADWGTIAYLWGPSGELWHITQFD